jgi:type I restriction enzyme S subunit
VVGFPIDEGVLSFQQLYDEAIVSPAYDVWEIRQGVLADPRYLELFLRSPSALTYYKSKLRGTTARRRTIPDDVFLALKTPLPPLPEQQRIAAILDHADALRAKRHAAIAKLDSLAQSIFLDMFGDPAYNPKRWRVGQLRDIIESANYGTSRPSEANGAVPMLRMNNISYSGKLDLTELKYIDLTPSERDRYLLANGDVLFNRTNSAELVGKTAVFRSHRPMTYAGYLVRLRPNAFGHGEYISGLLNSPYGKKTLRGMCKSIVGMANINAQEVQSIPCPIPPIELQQEFANRLAGLEKSKAMQDIAIGSLESLFESLQHRAFQGTL